MNRSLYLILLVIGVVLLVLGVIEADSISSSFSRVFTGEPTDRAIWLLISGALCTFVGLGGASRSPK